MFKNGVLLREFAKCVKRRLTRMPLGSELYQACETAGKPRWQTGVVTKVAEVGHIAAIGGIARGNAPLIMRANTVLPRSKCRFHWTSVRVGTIYQYQSIPAAGFVSGRPAQ
jgi:hypothetical protein